MPGKAVKKLFFICGLFAFLSGAMHSRAPQAALDAFLDKAAAKIKAYTEYENWKASVVSSTTVMDKNWTPESVQVVTKTIKVVNELREEEILIALETKKGKTKDITQKVAEEARKDFERSKKRIAEGEKAKKRPSEGAQKPKSDGRRQGRMDLGEFLPFSAEKRVDYDFRLEETGLLNGKPVLILNMASKVKDEDHFEGRFWFDPESTDLLQIEVKPAHMPKMVKEFEMRMAFDILQGRFLTLKSTYIKINGGIFIKHIRQVIEDNYTDFEILDGSGQRSAGRSPSEFSPVPDF